MALAARLSHLRPQLHVFGHVHEDHGAVVREWEASNERTVFVNAANKPAGPKAISSDGRKAPFGGGPYSPVIVDLYDAVADVA